MFCLFVYVSHVCAWSLGKPEKGRSHGILELHHLLYINLRNHTRISRLDTGLQRKKINMKDKHTVYPDNSMLAKGSLIILKNYLTVFVSHFDIFTIDKSWEFPSKKANLSYSQKTCYNSLNWHVHGRYSTSSLQDTPRGLKAQC